MKKNKLILEFNGKTWRAIKAAASVSRKDPQTFTREYILARMQNKINDQPSREEARREKPSTIPA